MNNAQKKLAWFGALALAGILIISFVPTTFHIGSYDFRKVDFVADVKKDSASSTGSKTVKGKNSHSTNTPVKVDSTRDDYFTYKDIINYSRSSKQPVGKFVQPCGIIKQVSEIKYALPTLEIRLLKAT